MILQGVYEYLRQDFTVVYFGGENGQTTSIRIKDWVEMGKPERVSVTVMKLLRRTA